MESIWEVFCCKCGGPINTQKDAYRHETDMEGKQRYFHIPACPKGGKDENLNRVVDLARSIH